MGRPALWRHEPDEDRPPSDRMIAAAQARLAEEAARLGTAHARARRRPERRVQLGPFVGEYERAYSNVMQSEWSDEERARPTIDQSWIRRRGTWDRRRARDNARRLGA